MKGYYSRFQREWPLLNIKCYIRVSKRRIVHFSKSSWTTKNGLKSSFLGFINRKTAQNDHNKILYMIMGLEKFHDLNPFGSNELCDHFGMVTWEFIERIVPGRNLPYEVFFVQL